MGNAVRDLRRLYEEEMGHPPPVDASDDAWQWRYRGISDEDRERLLDLIQGEAEAEQGEQESLF